MFGGRARAPQRRHLAFDTAGKMPALPVFCGVIEAESFPDKMKNEIGDAERWPSG